MKLSREVAIAWEAMVYLAGPAPGRQVAAHAIADVVGVSEGTLWSILRALVAAGFVDSAKGTRGGYCLARKATAISLLDVAEVIRGPLQQSALAEWHRPLGVRLQAAWEQALQALRRQLHQVRLADVVEKG